MSGSNITSLRPSMRSASGVVGPLAASATNVARVLNRDLVFQSCGYQDVAWHLQHVVAGDGAAPGKSLDAAGRCLEAQQGRNVDALLIEDTSLRIADGDHPGAFLPKQPRYRAANVSETLDGDGRRLQVEARHFAGFAEDAQTSARTGFGDPKK